MNRNATQRQSALFDYYVQGPDVLGSIHSTRKKFHGTTKQPFDFYICKEQQKQTFGKIYEISSCWRCDISIDQFILRLGTFFWIICLFSSDVLFVQWSSDLLVGCLHFPGKTKKKKKKNKQKQSKNKNNKIPFPNHNFGEVPF